MSECVRSDRIGAFGVFLMVALLATAGPAGSQVPGQRLPSRDRIRAEFLENILQGVNELRREWTEQIREDRLDPLMELYTEDAVLISPDGVASRGSEAIREFWSGLLPSLGSIESGLSDLDASGQMAMVSGSYVMHRMSEDGRSERRSGSLLTVFIQNGRTWRIRAQVFGHAGEG